MTTVHLTETFVTPDPRTDEQSTLWRFLFDSGISLVLPCRVPLTYHYAGLLGHGKKLLAGLRSALH
jgi:hypothetical protein